MGDVTREVLGALHDMVGPVAIDPTPQEVPWTVPLDEDREHARYDPDPVSAYLMCATQAALVLAEHRAPYRGRSTPVNAWWGSFDIAASLFSGQPAEPPSRDFIMRNSMDAEEVAVGWWPGDRNYNSAAFYAYAHPAPEGFGAAMLSPAGTRWVAGMGLYILDWPDGASAGPRARASALEFARSVFRHACGVCEWDPALAGSVEGSPPPVA